MAPVTKEYIEMYLRLRPFESEYVFCSHNNRTRGKKLNSRSPERILQKVVKLAGIEEEWITPYCLRHSYGTHQRMSGTPLIDIADAMGHVSVDTTRIYSHIATGKIKDINNALPLGELLAKTSTILKKEEAERLDAEK